MTLTEEGITLINFLTEHVTEAEELILQIQAKRIPKPYKVAIKIYNNYTLLPHANQQSEEGIKSKKPQNKKRK